MAAAAVLPTVSARPRPAAEEDFGEELASTTEHVSLGAAADGTYLAAEEGEDEPRRVPQPHS
jgi:hypothetical protein